MRAIGSAYVTYTYKDVTYENVWFADWDSDSPFKSSKSYRLGETVNLTIDPKNPGNPEVLTADYNAAMLLTVVGLVLIAAGWMRRNEG